MDLVPIPVMLFHLSGQPLFPVLNEQGDDVSASLGPNQRQTEGVVYVPGEQVSELRNHLLRCLPRIAGNQLVEPHLRAWLLHSILTFEVEGLLGNPQAPTNSRGLIEVTRAVGREGASWAATGNAPAYRHRHLVGDAFSPVAHAVNSALYATSIAAASGEENYEVLQGVALAAVFADIALEEASERQRIDRAAIIMRRYGVPSVGAVAGVLARYGHWDGGGIPKLAGAAIPFEARCIAIACDYDLLAAGYGAPAPHTPYEALSAMSERKGVYDPALLRLFVRLVAKIVVRAAEDVPLLTEASA